MKKHKKKKTNKRRDQETKQEHMQTNWALCSEDWGDVVITYVPDLNTLPIEENYADIPQEETKEAFLKFCNHRKPCKKKTQKVK